MTESFTHGAVLTIFLIANRLDIYRLNDGMAFKAI